MYYGTDKNGAYIRQDKRENATFIYDTKDASGKEEYYYITENNTTTLYKKSHITESPVQAQA
jgi:hypothetical protein